MALVGSTVTHSIGRLIGPLSDPGVSVPGGPPSSGLLSQLDGSVATSFWSDDGKTTNSTEGGAVAVWEDQSGNGNDWIQTNASYRPLAHLSAGRLYNDGTGTGTSKHLTGPNISAWTAGSFFARVQQVGLPHGAIWGVTSWNSANSLPHWSYFSDNQSHYVTFAGNSRPVAFAWTSLSEASTDLMTYEENTDAAALTKIYVNGTQKYSGDLGTLGFRTVPVLGAGIRSGAIEYSGQWYFYKVCMYNRIVSATERSQINAWLES